MLKLVLSKTPTVELGARMYMRLPSAQMAVTQPARENEATGDRWQGEGRERHGREAGSGLEDGTVGKQIPQPLGDLQGASFPAPGAAPAPGGNRRAWGRSEASSPHEVLPTCSRPWWPQRSQHRSWFKPVVFTIFSAPAVPLGRDSTPGPTEGAE